MSVMKEERTDILLAGSGTTSHVKHTFNTAHRMQITHDTEAKLIKKFKRTGSVADAKRSGIPKTATDKDSSTKALAAMASSPTSLFLNENQTKQCHVHFAVTSDTHTSHDTICMNKINISYHFYQLYIRRLRTHPLFFISFSRIKEKIKSNMPPVSKLLSKTTFELLNPE